MIPCFSRLTLPVLALLLVPASLAAVEREATRTFPLAPDGRISLENVNGAVRITSADVDQVTVRWSVDTRDREALDHLRIEIDARPERIRITTDQDDWRGWRWSGWSVEFDLEVPRTARLDGIDLVNGSLTFRGRHDGPVAAETVNGSVRADRLGHDVSISTVNGAIEVEVGELPPEARIDLESVNGTIELTLPEGAAFDVRAETVHGRIRNDFGLRVDEDDWVGRSMDDRTAPGGARLRLETVNGSIELRKR